MLFKVGDVVTIRHDIQGKRKWMRMDGFAIKYREYVSFGVPAERGYLLTNCDGEMRAYAGMKATIVGTARPFTDIKCYELDVDNRRYLWTDEMFEERDGLIFVDVDSSELFGFIEN